MIIHEVEQGSPEWLELRSGIPTASVFDKILTPTGKPSASIKPLAMQLAAEKLAGPGVDDFCGNEWTDRGHLHEPAALAWYEVETGHQVQRVGFVTDDAGRWGCSPDGVVSGAGGVEVKCPKASKVLAYFLEWKETGDAPKDYLPQVQGSLFVTGAEWWDLVIYHPLLTQASFVVRVYPDYDYHEKLREGLLECIRQRDEILRAVGA